MVRDPIDRMLSTTSTTSAAGMNRGRWRRRSRDPDSAYVARSRYAMQAEPYLEAFGAERVLIVTREELRDRRRGDDAAVFEFAGVDAGFRLTAVRARVGDWRRQAGRRLSAHGPRRAPARAARRSIATSTACRSRCAGWSSGSSTIPDRGASPKPELPEELRARLRELLAGDMERLEAIAGRELGYR